MALKSATIHDGHQTSTCFSSFSLSVSVSFSIRQLNQLSNPVPPPPTSRFGLCCNWLKNCEIRWGRLDRLRSKYLAESARAAFQPASVSGDQPAKEKPASHQITSQTNHKTKKIQRRSAIAISKRVTLVTSKPCSLTTWPESATSVVKAVCPTNQEINGQKDYQDDLQRWSPFAFFVIFVFVIVICCAHIWNCLGRGNRGQVGGKTKIKIWRKFRSLLSPSQLSWELYSIEMITVSQNTGWIFKLVLPSFCVGR